MPSVTIDPQPPPAPKPPKPPRVRVVKGRQQPRGYWHRNRPLPDNLREVPVVALLMRDRGITPRQLANDTGIHPVKLSHYINGKLKMSRPVQLNLAEYFGVPFDMLTWTPPGRDPRTWKGEYGDHSQ